MTRLRTLALGGVTAALVVTGAVSKSFAEEPADFTNILRGATIGLPLGAAPPPGLYSGFEQVFMPQVGSAGNQQFGGALGQTHYQVFIGAVPIVWSTGYNIFGGSLVLDAVQAFYTAGVWDDPSNAAGPGFTGGAVNPNPLAAAIIAPVVANTTWDAALSWKLMNGWFFAASFAFVGPDGSHYLGTPNPDYWSFQPHAALSYIDANWLLSANFTYDFNTPSKGNCCALGANPAVAPGNGYLSGQEFYLDLTALYKIGKWQIGPVAYWENQTTQDTPGGGIPCTFGPGGLCGKTEVFALGGLIGYDFGPVDLQVWATDNVVCINAGGCGLNFWTRLGFKIWGPEAQPVKPLVAKD